MESGNRVHRIMHESKIQIPKPQIHARTKVLSALDKFDWKTIAQLSEETGVPKNTVLVTTDRLYKAKRIERKKVPAKYGYVNMYRKK